MRFPLMIRLAMLLAAGALVGCSDSDDSGTDKDKGSNNGGDTEDSDLTGDTDITDTGTLCYDRELEVTIGMGEFEFNEVSDGDPVIVFHGPQGGWHVDAAVRVGNSTQDVFLNTKVRLVDEDRLIAGGDPYDFLAKALVFDDPKANCPTGEAWAVRGLINDEWPGAWPTPTEVCEWEGATIEVEVSVEDFVGGRLGSAKVELVAEMHWEKGPFDCAPFQ